MRPGEPIPGSGEDGALPAPSTPLAPRECLPWDPEEELAQAALADPAAEHLSPSKAAPSGPWRLLAVVLVALGALAIVFGWK